MAPVGEGGLVTLKIASRMNSIISVEKGQYLYGGDFVVDFVGQFVESALCDGGGVRTQAAQRFQFLETMPVGHTSTCARQVVAHRKFSRRMSRRVEHMYVDNMNFLHGRPLLRLQ